MMPENTQKTYPLTITTLSPVAIGNGEIMSPYTDFVFDAAQRKVHFIDKDKVANLIVEQDLAKGTDHLKQFIDGIYGAFNNNRSEFDLKDFIENKVNIGLDTAEYAQRSLPYYGLNPRDRREIKGALKDQDCPYIAGSSLKGAIKGALLYEWFGSDGAVELNKLMRNTLRTFYQCEEELREIAHLAGQRNPSRADRDRIKQLKRTIKQKGAKDLGRKIDKTISSLLTYDPRRMPRDFSHLKVSDSTLFDPTDFQLQVAKRIHYAKGQVTIPNNLESIRPDAHSTIKISVNRQFTHPDLQYLNGEKPLENLLDILNNF
ncbi:MAG: type III-A CRISPR-associated RAMP protein Csm5, partial [Bacteroidota bacterium]